MDFLQKIPALLKEHYEKVLLAVALVLLIGAVVVLYTKADEEQRTLKQYVEVITKKSGAGINPINFQAATNALRLAQDVPTLDFSPPNNLVNPVRWQRQADGSILKVATGKEVGPFQTKVTRILPLEFKIMLGQGGSAGFTFSFQREASTNAVLRYWSAVAATNQNAARALKDRYVGLNTRDPFGIFMLKEVGGATNAPEVTLELLDSGERVKLSREKPFTRTEGYQTDMAYPLESKVFANRRVGDVISISGEDYNIVDIRADGVVYCPARTNGKEYKRPYNPSP